MILSAQALFSDDQAITATAISTNVVDLGAAATPYGGAAALTQDIGKGAKVPLLIQVTQAFNNLTSLAIAVEVGATTALGAVLETQTILLVNLTVGARSVFVEVPEGTDARYLGIRYTVNGAAPTTGMITAGISAGNQTNVTGA